MRKILNSRFFRLLVCLVLVCCFLVNSSPIKAEAVVAEATAPLWVPAATVVAGVLIVIGIMAGADHTTFTEVVNNCVTWLTNTTSYVVNGMINVVGFVGADGITRSYVLKDMIQDIWGWSFDSGVVVSVPPSVAAGTSITFGTTTYTCSADVIPVVVRANVAELPSVKYFYLMVGGSTSFTVEMGGSTGASSYTKIDGLRYYYYSIAASSPTAADISKAIDLTATKYDVAWQVAKEIIKLFTAATNSVFTGSVYSDLTLGKIQAPTEEVQLEEAEVYTDYITKIEFFPEGQPDTGEDKKEHLPVGLPSTDLDDLLLSQSQQQAQSGETNLDFDFETSTDPDPGTGEPGTGTDPDSGSSSWNPPNDMGKFTLDLKDYFPFCIPFDMYDFFTCLNAEPVAPVIDWIIPMPGGDSYPLEIDLSVFDPVAQLLRRLELLAFCVGLAFKTRDLIKG